MAWNILPRSMPRLLVFANDALNGVTALQDQLQIKQNRADTLRPLLDAAGAAAADFKAAVAARLARNAEADAADRAAETFARTARDVFKPTLGTSWSIAWAAPGFAQGTLALPDTIAGRQELVRRLGDFLAEQPGLEVAPLGVTEAKAKEVCATLEQARAAARAAVADSAQMLAVREAAFAALRVRLQGLIAELTQLLAPDDARWRTFGLHAPGAPNRPEVPTHISAHAGPAGSGVLYIAWENSPRAARYRVWKQIAGVDSEFIAAVTVIDPDATLTDLPAGAVVKVRVTAANDTGETKPSEPVTVEMS
jgi:hypothetical protein